jgi:hypothetical protein
MFVASFIREIPGFVAILPLCGLDASVELDVFFEIMLFDNMLNVFQSFGLWREFFFPVPLIKKVFVP